MNPSFNLLQRGTSPELSDKFFLPATSHDLPGNRGKRYVLVINGSGHDNVGNIDAAKTKEVFEALPDTDVLCLGLQDLPATPQNIREYCSLVQACSNPGDEVVFFVTAHGDYDRQEAYLQLGDELVSSEEFKRLVEPIDSLRGFFLFTNCHSEYFARRLGEGNFIGVSTSTSKEECFAIEDEGTIFTTYFLDTIVRNSRAQRNVTLEQAFDTAVNRAARQLKKYKCETTRPQMYWQNNDPSKYYLL